MPSPLRLSSSLVLAAALLACGRSQYPAPSSPDAALRGFMAAVRADDLSGMGRLWGSARGPAVSYMSRADLEKRLTVIRSYLANESYEVLPGNDPLENAGGSERHLRVRLTRNGCTPVVPVTLVRYRDGWLVYDIDLTAAGSPARTCQPSGGAEPTR